MIPWERINALNFQASELKSQGNFAAALPLREESVRLLEEHRANGKHLASSWNYVAYLNTQIGDYIAAEKAARRSLAYYLEYSDQRDESLATYLWMLSVTLEHQNRFTEALPYAEECVNLFTQFHGADYHFVVARREELERIREQIWKG
jgi:tetratricopeptide (TPR) repeat protein